MASEEEEEGADDGSVMMMTVMDRLSSEYLIQSGKKNEFEIGHQASIGRKKKFSTETGFERGKTAEISKVYRLIIITNVLER